MNYIALARKWRPRTFAQLVGQDHITKALINSLDQQRLHHAYLFTGTRGVGKTSVARLLAKALNCEKGIQSEPCLQCDACINVEQGRFIDLIEIDGASKTRVEDTRDILENVQYAPTNGRFKIYLIDEVHMLSQHSFNALLKTLEEPPAHVKFLLATTDPQKLPITVLSRCLQFNLRHLQPNIIQQQLEFILNHEKIAYETTALSLLAKAAQGSMRDALSLLDQAIACSNNQLQADDIKQILGFTQHDYALQLLQALSALDATKLLTISQQIANEGGHFRHVIEEMLNHLHQICIYQNLSDANQLIAINNELSELSQQLSPEDTQLFYQIALKGAEEMLLAPTMAIGFDMILLRMYTFRPAMQEKLPLLAHQQQTITSQEKDNVSTPLQQTPPDAQQTILENNNALNNYKKNESNNFEVLHDPTHNVIISNQTSEQSWYDILPQLNLRGLALSAAENAEFISLEDTTITLGVDKKHQSLFTSTAQTRIEEALTGYYKKTMKVILQHSDLIQASPAQQKKVEQAKQYHDAEESLSNDPFFQQLQQIFEAEVTKNSITSIKDS